MTVFLDQIPTGSPVVVAFVSMPGCGACEEYLPIFQKVAASYAKRGLPIIKLDATTKDPDTIKFMNAHGVEATPTVVAAMLGRGPVAKLEGVATEVETLRLLEVAWAHNRSRL